CHNPGLSWGDGEPRAIGENQVRLPLRSPTLLNIAWIPKLGWDGHFRDLESVAMGPITGDAGFHDIGGAEGDDVGRGRLFPTSVKLQHAFKTPTLRDVARRAPYMHDGSIASLAEVIDLYDRGGIDRPSRDNDIRPLNLQDGEKADLIAFLNTLNGTRKAYPIPPWPASKAPPTTLTTMRADLGNQIEKLSASLAEDLQIAAGRSQSDRATRAAENVQRAADSWKSVYARLIKGATTEVNWDTLDHYAAKVDEQIDLLVNYTEVTGSCTGRTRAPP